MRKLIILLLLIPTLAIAAYALNPNSNYVDEVHYDADLNVIVIRVHAKILWFNVDEFYALEVRDNTDIQKHLTRILGEQPKIVHLKKI